MESRDVYRTAAVLVCLALLAGCGAGRNPMGMQAGREVTVTDVNYRIYTGAGNPATLADIVQATEDTDILFIGEGHGDPVGHYLEARILEALHDRYTRDGELQRPLVLSLEMFEQDVQTVLDEYLAGLITERHFLSASRPWPGYQTDYRPLIEFARTNGLPVIAANAPRRYVNRVSRLGPDALDDLSAAAKEWLPPLPYGEATPAYREKFHRFFVDVTGADVFVHDGENGEDAEMQNLELSETAKAKREKDFDRLLSAQSLWDAAMAHAIGRVIRRQPESLILHISGKFHSEEGLGIPEHVDDYQPGTKFRTVVMDTSENFTAFDPAYEGRGDFVILTDPDLLKARKPRHHP